MHLLWLCGGIQPQNVGTAESWPLFQTGGIAETHPASPWAAMELWFHSFCGIIHRPRASIIETLFRRAQVRRGVGSSRTYENRSFTLHFWQHCS
jgi:hypothetical protein